MAKNAQDEVFMQRALGLTAATVALASPNPQVGCVLVKDGEVVAEGAHLYDNRDHAEIAALKQAAERGVDVAGCTAYVTLEPCSHHGRTGPCADALIAAGVVRVVVATLDPNPQVRGEGVAKIRAAGIEVTVGTFEQQGRNLIEAFNYFILRGTPFVTLKAALSADGHLAPPSADRTPNQPFWLTGSEARAEVQHLRHASDAVLTGIGTVLDDDPALTDRSGLPRRRPLLRVVLDSRLRIPVDSQLVCSANHDLLILAGAAAPQAKIEVLRGHGAEVQIVAEQGGRLSLSAVLQTLGQRNILSLLLECGSQLNGAFLREDLVDKAVLFYSKTELGAQSLPFAEGVSSPFLFEQSLHRTERVGFGADTCVTGHLHEAGPVR